MTLREIFKYATDLIRFHPATPAAEAGVRRGRNPRMDGFLHRVNGSTRYDIANVDERTAKAVTQQEHSA